MTRSYADIGGAFRRGAAGSRAARGDFEGAAAYVANDPELADSYAQQGERVEQRRRRDEREQAQQSYADHYGRGDYAGAGVVAAKTGDVEGIRSARSAQQEVTQQQRVELWRGARDALTELEQIESAGGEGYSAFIERGRGALAQNPNMDPELRSLIESAPNEFNPRVVGAFRVYANRIRDRALSAEQIQEMEASERRDREGRRRQLTPQEVTAAGYRPGTVVQTDGTGQHYVTQSPLTPAQVSGGGGRTPQLAGAEQRGRIALSFTNIVEAQRALADLEQAAVDRQGVPQGNIGPFRGILPGGHGSDTPLGQDWGARIAEAVPFDGGSVARLVGGDDYQQYEAASRTFEQSVMPIFSGSAVTESEAQRFVRANLPRMNDSRETLQIKAQNRARIINAAAVILGAEPPFPEAGTWSPAGGLVAPSATAAPSGGNGGGGVGLESLTDEQLDALEQELTNAGR